MSSEDKLRQAMRQAHASDEAPHFGPIWSRARAEAHGTSRRPMRRILQGTVLAAAVALAVWLVLPGAPPVVNPPGKPPTLAQPVALASLTSWQGPTDFLLNTLDSGLLSSSPQVGNTNSLTMPGLGELNITIPWTSTQRR